MTAEPKPTAKELADARMQAAIDELVASAPPLTPEAREKIARLLMMGGTRPRPQRSTKVAAPPEATTTDISSEAAPY